MVVDVVDELRNEDEVMLKEEVDLEVDGIVKCRCGYGGDAKIRQGSTDVANTDISIKVDSISRTCRIYQYLPSDFEH